METFVRFNESLELHKILVEDRLRRISKNKRSSEILRHEKFQSWDAESVANFVENLEGKLSTILPSDDHNIFRGMAREYNRKSFVVRTTNVVTNSARS